MSAELLRKQAVVFFSDIVGYTRLMGKDEDGAFELMKNNLAIHQKFFDQYEGKIIKELGDGILGVFDLPQNAILASLEIQKEIKALGKFSIRVGMHCGDIIFDHGDVFGDAVNQSSRIQSVGIPSSVLISDQLFQQLPKGNSFTTTKLGGFSLKNVTHKVELHAIINPPLAIPKRSDILQNIKFQEKASWRTWAGLGVILLLLLSLGYMWLANNTVWKNEKSIAVIPFTNLNPSEEFDYFSDGLTENVIGQLSKIQAIKTINYSTMKSFKGIESPADSISRVLGVSALLRGELEWLSTGVRISLQLIDAEKNKNVWSVRYLREGHDITNLQNEIAREIARIFDANLSIEESSQIGKGETENLQAYEFRLKGNRLYSFFTDSSFQQAVNLYKKAIELDPNYALAYADLANAYSQLGYSFGQAYYDSSLEASAKSLALQPNLSEGFSAQGSAYYYMGKLTFAKSSFENALVQNPNLSQALGNIGTVYFIKGDLENALKYQLQSIKLGPNNYLPYQNLGWIYFILGQHNLALEYLDKSFSLSQQIETLEVKSRLLIEMGRSAEVKEVMDQILQLPGGAGFWGQKARGIVQLYLGEAALAEELLQKSFDTQPEFSEYISTPIHLAYLLNRKGQVSEASFLLDGSSNIRRQSMESGNEDFVLPLDLANCYAIQGNRDAAIRYLTVAYERGWKESFLITQNPAFKELLVDKEMKKLISILEKDINQINSKIHSTSLQRNK